MKNFTILLAIALFFSACDKDNDVTDDPDPNIDVSTAECLPLCVDPGFGQDEFQLVALRSDGECLEIDVRYGGGCKSHDFCLSENEFIITPNQTINIQLILHHNKNNDLCEALISRTLYFEKLPTSPIMAPMAIQVDVVGFDGQTLTYDR